VNTAAITLARHVLEDEKKHPEATGEFSTLLMQIGYAAKLLAREISRAALIGKLGLVGEKNPTGDAQKKLDVYANDTVVDAFADTGLVAAIVSEEMEKVKQVEGCEEARYILCTDPLDGSSNTDINGSIGTIFGIYRRQKPGTDLMADVLRKGAEQVAAGYVMYSTSTVLVYACGHGVFGFTLDRDVGEFLLSHDNIRCPGRGHYYSANVARLPEWHPGLRKYVDYLNQRDPHTGRPYSLRYTGALVADVHRGLIEGGLYFYPADASHKDGKLRLVYECAPLAYLVEAAGGRASTGTQRVLEIQPEHIHQRVPFVVGSTQDVELYESFLRTGSPPQ
jgi:fructose-1,6-bisphosphatase I